MDLRFPYMGAGTSTKLFCKLATYRKGRGLRLVHNISIFPVYNFSRLVHNLIAINISAEIGIIALRSLKQVFNIANLLVM